MNKKWDSCEYTNQILEYLLESFGQNEPPESLRDHWKLSQAAFDEGDNCFLQDEYIMEQNNILGLSDDALAAVLQVLSRVRDNPAAVRLIWHYHYMLFICKKDVTREVLQLSCAGKSMQNRLPFPAEMLPVLIALSGLREAVKIHHSLGIPYQITVDTFADIVLWMEDYHRKNSVWGLSELPWLYSHLTGRLYRIGRLQFRGNPFSGDVRVFRNKSGKEIVIFPETGQRYRKDGLPDGTNLIYDTDGTWVSALKTDDRLIHSNCILRNGYAVKGDKILPTAEWEPVLSKNDPILEVHIPAGSRLEIEECRKSFFHAIRFYRTYFPMSRIAAFCCGSWLLEPQFQEILPPASNIVRFQKLFHLYPIPGDEAPFLDRVFGYGQKDMPCNPKDLPRDTSLQRAIADHLISGKRLHPAAGILFPEEVAAAMPYENSHRMEL